MTNDERAALIERMAIARHEHRRRLTPLVVSFGWYDLDPEDQARMLAEERAALAAAEPAIRADEREACAKVALRYPIEEDQHVVSAHARAMQSMQIAVAIRARGEKP